VGVIDVMRNEEWASDDYDTPWRFLKPFEEQKSIILQCSCDSGVKVR
jgi:hypothetical protein